MDLDMSIIVCMPAALSSHVNFYVMMCVTHVGVGRLGGWPLVEVSGIFWKGMLDSVMFGFACLIRADMA